MRPSVGIPTSIRPISVPQSGEPVDERARAVDGIDYPGVATLAGNRAVLLANDTVAGKALHNGLADGPLGGPVGGGDGIEAGEAGLVLDGPRLAEMGKDRLTRNIREYMGEFEVGPGRRIAGACHST